MIDLTTQYLGMKLKNPLVASASPLTKELATIKRLEDYGVAAVVMHSLFEEQINHEQHQLDHFLHTSNDSYAEALEYLPNDVDFTNMQADHYLQELRKIKESVDIPIIASLNGVSSGGWINYGHKLLEAGADALELNITYIPTSLSMSSVEVEELYLKTLRDLKEHISVPLNLKMNPYFSAPAHMAKRFADLGVSGLTLFDNPVEVDIDLETLAPLHKANITSSKDKSETLRWCAILYNQLNVDLCANTGIHSAQDILKALMSGANVCSFTSVLLQKGDQEIEHILKEMIEWMEEKEYHSTDQMRGSISLAHTSNPAAFERNSYIGALQSFQR